MGSRNILRVALLTGFILLVPLVAMQFTDEVDWNLTDFVTVGVLLFGAGVLYELIAVKVRRKDHRLILSVAVGVAVLYIWAELAVGIFTNLGS